MLTHTKIVYSGLEESTKEMLIAKLSLIGFDGFEEENNDLLAYINQDNFDNPTVSKISKDLNLTFEKSEVPHTNWNKLWESNYSPVIVGEYCAIRASFHPTIPGVLHEIVITPKMSFGTGHHATTYMMIQMMENIQFENKIVLDFGTGTGVLSILAEKENATSIFAIDNDSWSVENAIENKLMNQCNKINIELTEKIPAKYFDIILANINKDVIKENLTALSKYLKTDGILLLSGLLETDLNEMISVLDQHDLQIKKELTNQDGYACFVVIHNNYPIVAY